MNVFERCGVIGDGGVGLIVRWLKHRAAIYDGRLVRTDKGRIALELQRTVGDVLFNSDETTIQSIEIKTEASKRPNLFLETWSNAADEVGRRREGWMRTLSADWLFYYFVDTDELYTVRLPALQQWAFGGTDGSSGRIFDYPEKIQRKHSQLNITKGRCVPIAVIGRDVGLRKFRPAAELAANPTTAP